MKKITYLPFLIGILVFPIVLIGCKKNDRIETVALENTTWKLTREERIMTEGDTVNVERPMERTYFFLDGNKIKVVNGTGNDTWEKSGEWHITDDKLIIKYRDEAGQYYSTTSYKINEKTKSVMKLQIPDGIYGLVFETIFELTKQ
jgi:hypothetical protein